jgi:hypothetical protein
MLDSLAHSTQSQIRKKGRKSNRSKSRSKSRSRGRDRKSYLISLDLHG